MSEFELSLPKGELAKQIALRGLTQQEFAAKAGISDSTLLKAIRGGNLRSQNWGKILIALGAVPEIPEGLAPA
jgi:predicted transcriptional regulator